MKVTKRREKVYFQIERSKVTGCQELRAWSSDPAFQKVLVGNRYCMQPCMAFVTSWLKISCIVFRLPSRLRKGGGRSYLLTRVACVHGDAETNALNILRALVEVLRAACDSLPAVHGVQNEVRFFSYARTKVGGSSICPNHEEDIVVNDVHSFKDCVTAG